MKKEYVSQFSKRQVDDINDEIESLKKDKDLSKMLEPTYFGNVEEDEQPDEI